MPVTAFLIVAYLQSLMIWVAYWWRFFRLSNSSIFVLADSDLKVRAFKVSIHYSQFEMKKYL